MSDDTLSWETIRPSFFRGLFPEGWLVEQDMGVVVPAEDENGPIKEALRELEHPKQHMYFENRNLLIRDAVFETVQKLRHQKLDETLRSRQIEEVQFVDTGAQGRLYANPAEEDEPDSSPSHSVVLRELSPVATFIFGHEVGHTFFFGRRGRRYVRIQGHNRSEELFCDMFSLSWLVQKRTIRSLSNYVLLSRLLPLWYEEGERWRLPTVFRFRWWHESWGYRFLPTY